MIVWIAVRSTNTGELFATAHESLETLLAYLRYLYVIPTHVAEGDVMSWIGANSTDRVKYVYDEVS